MSSEFTIKKIGGEYDAQMLELFNCVFNKKFSMETWHHKHRENPLGESLFWGAFDGERLIAINGFIPMTYCLGNKEFYVLQSCDSAVNPDFRHRGLFSKLICAAEEWAKDNKVDFFIGMPNMFSSPGFQKLNWSVAGTGKSFGVLTSLSKWIKMQKRFRPLADIILVSNSFFNVCNVPSRKYRAEKINIDRFLHLHKQNQEFLCCKYEETYLKWKLKDEDEIWLIMNESEPILMVVIRGDHVLYYENLSKNLEMIAKAWRKIAKVFHGKCGMLIVYSESYNDIANVLRRGGFVTRREPLYDRIIKCISEDAKKALKNGIAFNAIEGD